MKILITTCFRNIVGGIEKYLQSLIPVLLLRGHQVAMVYEHASVGSTSTVDPPEAGLEVWHTEDLRRYPDRWRSLVEWKADVVYSHGMESRDIEGVLLRNYATVLYTHGYWGTCVTGRKSHAFPEIRPCTRTLGTMCLVLYYPRRCGGMNPLTAWKMFQIETERKARFGDYQAVLVASAHMYRELERSGVTPDRLHLVSLPVTNESRQTTSPGSRAAEGRVLFMGRLVDIKGVDFLIKAIPVAAEKLGRPLTLTVAGEGSERHNLEDLARRMGVAAEFSGWVGEDQKLDLMRKADLLAVPSLWPEPFGLVGLEAACQGLPAVGYAVGGIPDWLLPGQTGELAPGDPPTVEGLAAAIVRAFATESHYTDLCRGAWEKSRQFSVERHLLQLEAILSAAVTQSVPQPAMSR